MDIVAVLTVLGLVYCINWLVGHKPVDWIKVSHLVRVNKRR